VWGRLLVNKKNHRSSIIRRFCTASSQSPFSWINCTPSQSITLRPFSPSMRMVKPCSLLVDQT